MGCELGDEDECFATWAARPSDFAGFLVETGLEGMWTLALSETAQSSAALVAFFNGRIGDDTVIGPDREGVDWGTVDRWARLRADAGIVDPVRIELWEFGNEVFAGRPDSAGRECASFGWEGVWTCDGDAYVRGDGEHDGLIEHRRAMKAVDDSVLVGAVGVADPTKWNDWGDKVISATDGDLDYYILHHYGFTSSPRPEPAIDRPAESFPGRVDTARASLPDGVPIAVTEYNLVAAESGDDRRTMTTALGALYLAEMIAQLAIAEIGIANQWNLANGRTRSGTDYGMIDADTWEPTPQFEAFAAWSRAGRRLHEPVAEGPIRAYPTSDDDGRTVVIIVNGSGTSHEVGLVLVDAAALTGPATVTSASTETSDSTTMTTRRRSVTLRGGDSEVVSPGGSITTIEVAPPRSPTPAILRPLDGTNEET